MKEITKWMQRRLGKAWRRLIPDKEEDPLLVGVFSTEPHFHPGTEHFSGYTMMRPIDPKEAEREIRRLYRLAYPERTITRVSVIPPKETRIEPMTVCVWCDEPLRFDPKKGWVHASDGEIYKKRPDGTDDHCALPKREEI